MPLFLRATGVNAETGVRLTVLELVKVVDVGDGYDGFLLKTEPHDLITCSSCKTLYGAIKTTQNYYLKEWGEP